MAITTIQSTPFPPVPLLAGQVKTVDPAEENQLFDLLYDYETVQLSSGLYSRAVQFAGTGRVALYLDQYGASSHNLGSLRGDRLAICLPVVDQQSNWWGHGLTAGLVPITRSGKTLHMTFQPQHAQLVLVVDRELYCSEWQQGSRERQVDVEKIFGESGQRFLTIDVGRLERWQHRLGRLLHDARPSLSQHAAVAFEHEMLAAFHSLTEPADIGEFSGAAARHVVEVALEQADASYKRAPAIADLCVAVGVSRRTLELAFRTVVGVSPLKFLTQRRLCRTYAALANASTDSDQVTNIALTYGFTELGRFATKYRQAFGELPSETLRKAAGLPRQVFAA